MVATKKLGVVAATLSLALLALAACDNQLTGVDAGKKAARSSASRDSTGDGTCLTGWIIVDGIATCPGGH